VRILADTNIAAHAVRAMRDAGHDVVYVAERAADPGDEALLLEALSEERVLVTKDQDISALTHRDMYSHHGVLRIDDLGDPVAEARLILTTFASHHARLAAAAFLRVGKTGVRESSRSG
jgi:predicted nuclease of predicted toxin-antitoxin system